MKDAAHYVARLGRNTQERDIALAVWHTHKLPDSHMRALFTARGTSFLRNNCWGWMLPPRTRIRIISVGESDPLFPERAKYEGQEYITDSLTPWPTLPNWYMGNVHQWPEVDASDVTFLQVAVELC